MGLESSFEHYVVGGILIIVLLSFLTYTTPIAQETLDDADAGVFAMAEGTKLFLGLVGFVFVSMWLYTGIKKMLTPDRTQIEGYR